MTEDDGRRDRTGEIEIPAPHDTDACTGWLGEDGEGRPRPCLECKPHLRRSAIERRLPLGGRRAVRNPRPTHDAISGDIL